MYIEDFNEGHYAEALYTLNMMMGNLSDYLLEAPAVVKCNVTKEIEGALDHLMNAYQTISRVSFEGEG